MYFYIQKPITIVKKINKLSNCCFYYWIQILFIFFTIVSCNKTDQNFLSPIEKTWIQNNKEDIEVLFGYSAPPNAFYNDKGEYEGLLVDFFKEIEKKLEVEIKVKYFNQWSDLIAYSKTAKNFIIVGIAYSERRSEYLNFTNALIRIPYVIITRKDSNIKSMDDLNGKKLCIDKKYAIRDYLLLNYANYNPVELTGNFEGLREVSLKTYDAYIANQMYATYKIDKQGISNLKIAGESGYNNSLSVGVSKNNLKLFDIINKTVNHIDEKKKKEIYNKWIYATTSELPSSLLNVIYWVIGLGSIVLLSLWLWSISLRKKVLKKTHLVIESETKYRKLIENSYDAIFIQQKGQFKLINKQFEELFGYTEKELLDPNFDTSKLLSPNEKVEVEKLKEKYSKLKKPFKYEFKGLTKNNKELFLEVSISYLMYGNGYTIQGIVHDITNRKIREIELVKAKEKAEESDRLKTAFLANMSHEIRTPMSGILGFAELLEKQNISEEKKQNFLKIIKQSGNRMLNTVNDLIDISKIETNQVSLVLSKININHRIGILFNFFKLEAENKGISLNYSNGLSDELAYLEIDKSKFDSILSNLIKNAIKFTIKGQIDFGYKLVIIGDKEFLQFYVKDTGIGIPSNRLEAVFNRFEQADLDDKFARQGSGLGLAITKSYVEMHGGKIWLESIEGTGSQFYFTIPHVNYSNKISKTEEKVCEINELEKTKIKKILIVEDDDISAIYLKEILSDENLEITHVKNGKDAIEFCKKNLDVDIVLMDVKMKDMNGYETAMEIRKFNKQIIIIAQTAFTFSQVKEKAFEAGCNDFISKPINRDELLNKINLLS